MKSLWRLWPVLGLWGCIGGFPEAPSPRVDLDASRDAGRDMSVDALPLDAASPPDAAPACDALEICDGVDQDCDGVIDEAVPLRDCPLQAGVCQGARQPCVGGDYRACEYATLPGYRPMEGAGACDGVDNDCDGAVDEGCECQEGARACGTDVGICRPGMQLCADGAWGPCAGGVQPREEGCDAVDEDCDGRVDEGAGGGECRTEAPGRCGLGAFRCEEGDLKCVTRFEPEPDDLCDGEDSDCDGRVDEDHVEGRCETGEPGDCAQGRTACVGGAVGCVGGLANAVDEVRDGRDNDCDGEVDEGLGRPPFFDLADASVGGDGTRPGVEGQTAALQPIVRQPGAYVGYEVPAVDGVFVPARVGLTDVGGGRMVDFSAVVMDGGTAGLHGKGPAGLIPHPNDAVPAAPDYGNRALHSFLEMPSNYGITFDLRIIGAQMGGAPTRFIGRVGNSGESAFTFAVLVDGAQRGFQQVRPGTEEPIELMLVGARWLSVVALDAGGARPRQGPYLGDPVLHRDMN